MKKVVLTIATVIFTLGAYAQSDTTKRSWDKSDNSYSSNSENQNHTDGYYFKDGKVVLVRNGKTTPLDREVTLTNGTKITDDGYYTEKGGTKMKFKEGEHIDLSGKRTSNVSSIHGQNMRNQNYSNGYLFQNGRMLKIENGNSTPVDKDITLDNGTIITSRGDYTKRGGTKTRFNEGDHIDRTGKIVAGKSARNIDGDKSNKNMYLLNDSTNNKKNRN